MLHDARTAPLMTAPPRPDAGEALALAPGQNRAGDPFAMPPARGRIGDPADAATLRDALLGLGLVSLGLALAGVMAGAMVLD